MSARLCVCLWLVYASAFAFAQASFVFPDSVEKYCDHCGNRSKTTIPIEMVLRLNEVTDEEQLKRHFLDDGDGHEEGDAAREGVGEDGERVVVSAAAFGPLRLFSDRFGGGEQEEEQIERKAVLRPKPAGCSPENQSVSLRVSDDPWVYYWPACTRVERCGGCCNHPLLSCQPIATEELNFKVKVTEYVGNKLVLKGEEIVPVLKHTKCKCDCTTKQQDCSPLQEYRKGECRCVCRNRDAEAKCNAENRTNASWSRVEPLKHWNPETCGCECLAVFDCTTGTHFSQATCSCESGQIDDETSYDRYEYNSTSMSRMRRPQIPSYTVGRK